MRRGRDIAAKSLDDLLADLRAPEKQPRKRALELLMRTPVDPERREEIALAIAGILRDPDVFTRNDAAKTLAYWGGKECTPAIIQGLSTDDHFFKESLLDAVAAIKDPAAADAVADCLPKNRERAGKALRAIGSEAEGATMKYLTHPDVFVRTEACKVLKVIGTKKCIPALQLVYRKANGFGFDADAAKDAAQTIGLPKTGKSSSRKKTGK
jgi:HEAT repeat protein